MMRSLILTTIVCLLMGLGGGYGVGYMIYEPKIRSYEIQISELASEVSRLSQTVSSQEAQISTLQADLNRSKAEVTDYKQRVSTLQSQVSNVQERLDNILGITATQYINKVISGQPGNGTYPFRCQFILNTWRHQDFSHHLIGLTWLKTPRTTFTLII